jgi:oligoribonuclease
MILWLDLETTGTDERLDWIIEVGAILTDDRLEEIARLSEVVRPTSHDVESVLSTMVPEVRAMHTSNGLIAALRRGEGRPLRAVEGDLVRLLRIHSPGQKVPLAGSGVAHFDSRFVRVQMPFLAEHLYYFSLDVGSFRRIARLAGVKYPQRTEPKNHRALDDIVAHLDEGRWYLQFLRNAKGAPDAA